MRIPHLWLKDGRALQDLAGAWYTFVDLHGDTDTTQIEAAFAAIGAPLEVLRLDEPAAPGSPYRLARRDGA